MTASVQSAADRRTYAANDSALLGGGLVRGGQLERDRHIALSFLSYRII